MSVISKYKRLFEVKILHHFFLNMGGTDFDSMSTEEQNKIWKSYDLRGTLEFHPSSYAARNLECYNLIFKTTRSGFVVLSRIDQDNSNQPFLSIENLDLSFYMILRDTFFDNYSLGHVKGAKHIAYFNNYAGSNGSTFPDLSNPPSSFTSGEDYEAGSLVEFSGNYYEAVENLTNATTNPDQTGSGWRSVSKRGSVNNNDQIAIYQNFIPFTITIPDIELTAALKNIEGHMAFSEQMDTFNGKKYFYLEPSFIREGYYKVEIINNSDSSILESFNCYLFKEFVPDHLFGVLQILGGSDKGNYSTNNAMGKLTSPKFQLRFRNRHTYWRYLNNEDHSLILETDLNPLTFKGFISIMHNGEELPNPDIRMIKPGPTKTYSEVII